MKDLAFIVAYTPSFASRAAVCIHSITQHHPNAHIEQVIVNSSIEPGTYVPNLARLRLATVRTLIQEYSNVIMLGADCVLYSSLNRFLHSCIAAKADLGLVPHVLNPPIFNGAQLYRTGHANADIVYFSNRAEHILNWLLSVPFEEKPSEGLFYEQTWLSAAPFLFDKIHIYRGSEVNLAYFNLHERFLQKINDIYLVNGEYLAMVQFSGYEKGKPERVSRHYSGPDIKYSDLELFKEYDEKIIK